MSGVAHLAVKEPSPKELSRSQQATAALTVPTVCLSKRFPVRAAVQTGRTADLQVPDRALLPNSSKLKKEPRLKRRRRLSASERLFI